MFSDIPYPHHIPLFNLHFSLNSISIDINTFTSTKLESDESNVFDELINDMGLNRNYEIDIKWADYFTFVESKSNELSIPSN
jgi:hypothetical protein